MKDIPRRISVIFRTIPDFFPHRRFLNFFYRFSSQKRYFFRFFGTFMFFYFGILMLFLCLILLLSYQVLVYTTESYRGEQEALEYWEDVVASYGDYPDAYYNAAYYAARIGEMRLAATYVEQALYLDREFEEALLLREEILSR